MDSDWQEYMMMMTTDFSRIGLDKCYFFERVLKTINADIRANYELIFHYPEKFKISPKILKALQIYAEANTSILYQISCAKTEFKKAEIQRLTTKNIFRYIDAVTAAHVEESFCRNIYEPFTFQRIETYKSWQTFFRKNGLIFTEHIRFDKNKNPYINYNGPIILFPEKRTGLYGHHRFR